MKSFSLDRFSARGFRHDWIWIEDVVQPKGWGGVLRLEIYNASTHTAGRGNEAVLLAGTQGKKFHYTEYQVLHES